MNGKRPKVVIIGAGFGGLRAAKRLRGGAVDVLVLDRHNFHMFQPLLYEVAAAGLEPDDIAQPVRAILRGAKNVRFRMADVQRVDVERKRVLAEGVEIPYDYAILAAGSTTSYYGVDSAERHALGLKDLHEATAIRNRVLRAFEQATITKDAAERDRLMTVVVIGGGPTGVELSGALAELKHHVLPRDYPDLDLSRARVILLEATDRLLAAMSPKLQRKAAEQLRALGVEIWLNSPVNEVTDASVTLANGETIAAGATVWVAGVRAEPIGETLSTPQTPAGRLHVTPELHLESHHDVYVIGDMAYLAAIDGAAYPMMAPVAIQQGEQAAANILRAMRGEPQRAFRFTDRGTMATIGRRKAVAHVFGRDFWGFPAWVLWLMVHLIQLVGFRNRALVLTNWIWNYFRYDRANRLVTDAAPPLAALRGGNGASPSRSRRHSERPLRPLG